MAAAEVAVFTSKSHLSARMPSKQILPWIRFTHCWDVMQPTNETEQVQLSACSQINEMLTLMSVRNNQVLREGNPPHSDPNWC